MRSLLELALAIIIFFLSHSAFAGTITAEVDRTRSTDGEPIELVLTLNGSLSGDVEIPKVDGLEFSQAGQSMSTSIINGTMTTERQLTYIVSPGKKGRIEIPPFKAKLDGKVESTLPITIEVGAAPQGSQPQAQNGPAQPNVEVPNDDKIFVVREIPKSEFYVGEVIPTTVKIYSKVRITRFSKPGTSAPNFRAIAAQGEKQYREEIRGEIYNVNEVYELLIAKKAGSLALPTFSVDVEYIKPNDRRQRSGDPFDIFNFLRSSGMQTRAKIESPKKTVKIIEPPTEGRPSNYMDIVGQFQGSVNVSAQKAKVGDTITITMTVDGNGALDSMPDPKFDFSKVGKAFLDRPDLQETFQTTGIKSKRIQKIALVPSTPGKIEIPSLSVSYFDPKDKKYKLIDLKTSPIEVEIDPNAITPATANQTKKEDLPVEPTPAAKKNQILDSGFLKKVGMILAGIVALLVFGVIFQMIRSKWKSHLQKPNIIAKQNEKDAQNILSDLRKAKNIEQIFESLQRYVSKLEPIEISAVTSRDILNAFTKRSANPEMISAVSEVLKAYDKSRYSTLKLESFDQLVKQLIEAMR